MAGWGVLLLILAVCVWGIRLTVIQRRHIGATLLEVHSRSAAAQLPGLGRLIDDREEEILEALSSTADEPTALAGRVAREPLVSEPFFFSRGGEWILPLVEESRVVSPLVSDEPPPPEFERALLVTFSSISPEEKVQPLEEIHESQGMSARWRLRALATAAAVRARSGQVTRALSDYRSLFEEFAPQLRSSTHPSYLQLVLARGECLLRAGRWEEAREMLLEGLEEVRSGSIRATLEEEGFFLSRVHSLLLEDAPGRGAPGIEDRLLAARKAVDSRRLSVAVVRTLVEKAVARGSLDRPRAGEEEQRYFQESRFPTPWDSGTADGVRSVLAVWRPVREDALGTSWDALGYRVDLVQMEAFLAAALARHSPVPGLVIRISGTRDDDSEGGEFVSLADFPGERSFITIGFEKATWDRLVGAAEKPFLIAGVLLGGLAVVLTLGLLAFLRAVRKQVKLASMKTEFVANVSHELKTPLALIRLFGETLLLERVPDRQRRRRYYEIITRESERLAHLIANVLNFASIDAGKKSYDLVPCDIGEVVRETYESYRHHLDEKGFTHSLTVESDLPRVRADRDAVAQAVINLLENALKYSPDRKDVSIGVTTAEQAVRIAVRDRGIGISREEQERIWDDFYRARAARTLATRGSGLGLSLVRHIVEAHGGRIEVDTNPGEGSTFCMVFPRTTARDGMEPERGF